MDSGKLIGCELEREKRRGEIGRERERETEGQRGSEGGREGDRRMGGCAEIGMGPGPRSL